MNRIIIRTNSTIIKNPIKLFKLAILASLTVLYSISYGDINTNIAQEIQKAEQLQIIGKDELAIKVLDRALLERIANSDALYLKAKSLIKIGKIEDARQNLEEALWFAKNRRFTKAQIQLELAKCYFALDKKEKALEIIQRASIEQPQSFEILLEMGRYNLVSGNKSLAITNFKGALQLEPNNSEIKITLADALLSGVKRGSDQASINEARDISYKLLETFKTSDPLWRSSIMIYIRSLIELGELDEADRSIKKALKQFPQDIDISRLNSQITTEKLAIEQKLS